MSDTLRSLLERMLSNPSTDIPFIDHRQWPDTMLATPEGKALAALVEAAVADRAYYHKEGNGCIGRTRSAVDALLALVKEGP